VTPSIVPDVPGPRGDRFQDVTEATGIRFVQHVGDGLMNNIVESVGSGGCLLDADGDGRLDVYLVDQGWKEGVSDPPAPAFRPTNRLFHNRGDGTFEDVTARAGVGDDGFGISVAAADYDNDGDVDLYVLNDGPNRLYRNRGDGTFEDVTAAAGVGCDLCSVAGTFFDADGDGLLDLYVGNYLTFDPSYKLHYAPDVYPGPLAFNAQADVYYHNQGDGTFVDRTAGSGFDVLPGRAMGVVATDFDGDGRTDVFVANDASANFLFHNEGGGRFREVGLESGVAFGFHGEATAAMAAAIGDVDGDGLPDMHVTDAAYGSLYRNLGGLRFQDLIRVSGIAPISGQWVSWGGGFLDYDLDGDLDLFLVDGDLHHPTGRPDLLLENRGADGFVDASAGAGAYFRAELLGRGGLIGDLDDDGQLDVVVTTIGDRAVVLRNRGEPGRHWVTLALEGRTANRDAFGATVVVEAGGKTYRRVLCAPACYVGQGDKRLHFGLGDANEVTRLEVTWPGGAHAVFEHVPVDRIHRVVEGEGLQ
jgi:hypothetical protein